MKKVLLVVALLLLATPVFAADVTITATKVGTPVGTLQKVNIGYTGAASADAIRAFALSLTTDLTGDANIANIRDFNRGESNKPGGGFGIFPAKFRDVVNPTTPDACFADGRYSPLATWGDANAGWGNNTKWIVVELGTLYKDANTPGTSGTLFAIDVNSPSGSDCNLCIALDQIRGGVVKKDANAATVTLPPGGSGAPAGCLRITYAPPCVTPLNEVGVVKATAVAAWVGQGFTDSGGTPVVDCVNLGKIISQETSCIALPHAITYTYGVAPAEPNVAGMTRSAAAAALTALGFVVGADVNVPPTATYATVLTVRGQNPPAGSVACGTTVNLSVVSYPIKTMTVANSLYVNWVNRGKPQCWAYPRQCRGDADGKKQVSFWVGSNDLTILRGAISKLETAIPLGGICADFDHKKQVSFWVGSNDLNILRAYISKLESLVPVCGTVLNPSTDPNYWYFCVPTGVACPTTPAGTVCAPAGICPNTP